MKDSDSLGNKFKKNSNVQSPTSTNNSTETRKRNGLKIASYNIVSLRKYKDELSLMLNENQIDIIGLNETRLNQTIKDQ